MWSNVLLLPHHLHPQTQTCQMCGWLGWTEYIPASNVSLFLEILSRTCALWQLVLPKGGNCFQKAMDTLYFQKWKDTVWTIWRQTAARESGWGLFHLVVHTDTSVEERTPRAWSLGGAQGALYLTHKTRCTLKWRSTGQMRVSHPVYSTSV